MSSPAAIAAFLRRLATTIEDEGHDSRIVICDDHVNVVGEDGRVSVDTNGAEAIVIVHGEALEEADANLLISRLLGEIT